MDSLGRALMLVGALLVIVGAVIYAISRTGLPLGRLPGDIRLEGNGFTCLFPLATMILISVVLTVVLNLLARLLNR